MSHAVLRTSRRSCSSRTRDSAIQSRMTPCSDSGRPKATRLETRSHMSEIAISATPIERMQWWIRPGAEAGLGDGEALALAGDEVARGDPDVVEGELGVATWAWSS